MGWPKFNGKYVTYPRFKKEVVGLQRNLSWGHSRYAGLLFTEGKKCPGGKVQDMVVELEDLTELWQILDMATTGWRSVLQRPCNK